VASSGSSLKGWLVILIIGLAAYATYHYWPQPEPIAPEAVRRPVLAVLIFDNLNQQPDLDFLANAFTREIIAKIGQVCSSSFDIIAHHSVVSYRNSRKTLHQIGRELGVDYVLEGGARKDGELLHVVVQLTRVSDHTVLWKQDYDRPFVEASKIQNQIIEKIAGTLGVRIEPGSFETLDRAGTNNSVAREAYLRGVDRCESESEKDLKPCIASFEKALQADPVYPRAHAGLADALLRSKGNYDRAEEHVREALSVTDAIAQAHTALGQILYQFRHNDEGADAEFKKAIAVNRSDENAYLRYAQFLLEKKRLEEAQEQIQRSMNLDPFAVEPNVMLGRILIASKSYDRASEQLEKAVGMNRDDPDIRFYLAESYLAQAMYDDAVREFEKAVSFGHGVPDYAEGLERAKAAAEEAKARK
jgi:TolB-like protein/Tfp pilus assembly protein PilF